MDRLGKKPSFIHTLGIYNNDDPVVRYYGYLFVLYDVVDCEPQSADTSK